MGKVEAMGKHCSPVLQGTLSPIGNLITMNDIKKKRRRAWSELFITNCMLDVL